MAISPIMAFARVVLFILPDMFLVAIVWVMHRRRQFVDFPLFFFYLCMVALNDAIRASCRQHPPGGSRTCMRQKFASRFTVKACDKNVAVTHNQDTNETPYCQTCRDARASPQPNLVVKAWPRA